MADLVPFGDLLRRARLAAGLTQEALAERAGISPRGMGYIERGMSRAPQRATVALLAEALGLAGPERQAFEAAARRLAARGAIAPPEPLGPAPDDPPDPDDRPPDPDDRPPATAGPPAPLPERPTGTVTVLYTDIEGSTARWERDPPVVRAAPAAASSLTGSLGPG